MSLFRHGHKVYNRRSKKKIVVAILLSFAIFVGGLFAWYNQNIQPLQRNNDELVTATIEEGMNEAQVGALLKSKKLIRSALAYEVYMRINGKAGKAQAGTYKISASMNIADIASKITTGDVAVDLFTILPAQRLSQIKESFVKAGYSEQEIEEALDPAQYKDHSSLTDKPPLASLEGYLYPESFHKTAGTPLSFIINESLNQMDDALSDSLRSKFTEKGLTIFDAITIASIVEKEVSNPEDKPIVAQVFMTRLQNGMALGSDVTAYYGASLLGLKESVLTDTAYNTRIYAGLPPGPISNVSLSSLQAVAEPSQTDYLFFVAGDDGKTYFSHTVAQHEALIAAHCKKLCSVE